MTIQLTNLDGFDQIPDPNTEKELLPLEMVPSDNSLWRRHLKLATREAIRDRLTPLQRLYLELHFWQGMGKSQIARMQGVSCSTVTRTMAAGMESIRQYATLYMGIFDRVSRDIYDEMQEDGL